MAINYNDPYNQGIGTLDLGNMNVGQVPVNNMQVAEVFNTPQSLMDIGAVKPGKVFGYNLTDQGKALEDFRNSAVNFRNAPANTANTAQSAFNFMIDRPGSYGNVIENQDFIQDAINKGFLSTPEDYENQKSFADPDDLQASLDDDEYDFSDIEGQTASLINPVTKKMWDMLRMYNAAKKIKKHGPKVLKTIGTLTGGKAAAAAPTSHAEAKSTGGDYHSDTRSTVDGQTTEWGDELFSRGGLAQYAPRGSYFNGGLASLWLR